MIKRFSIILSVVICAVSCADELHEGVSPSLEGGTVMTKVVNTPVDAQEGVLLLCLQEAAADAFVAGDNSLSEEMTGKMPVKSFAPLFVIKEGKEEVARKHNLHRWFKMEFDGLGLSAAAAKIAQFDAVAKIQFDKTLVPASDCKFIPYTAPAVKQMSADVLPFNDPMLGDQWHYINTGSAQVSNSSYAGGDIAVKDAWKLTGGDPSIVVAVIDSPVKYDHPDLEANMWVNTNETAGNGKDDDGNGYVDDIYGWNCVSCSPQVWHDGNKSRFVYTDGQIDWSMRDVSGHGTHVAGIVAAVNGNSTGISGVAGGTGNNDGVRMMALQIFEGSYTSVSSSAIAFQYAADNGASIAQCSFGLIGAEYKHDAEYEMSYKAEHDALNYFLDKANNNSDILDGNIVIAAAGNECNPFSSYPAACQDVVSVTGLGPDFLPATNYTNYGPGCNIAAPGGDVFLGNMNMENKVLVDNRSCVLSTFINNVNQIESLFPVGDYAYMQGTSMACPHVSGVAALGLSYALKLGKTFSREDFISMLLTSVTDIDSRLIDNSMKTCGEEYGSGIPSADLGLYRGKMGTGAVDAWKLLMSVEGTPTLTILNGKSKRYDISSYFGGKNLKYLSVEVDDATREALGLMSDPEIDLVGDFSTKPLKIHPTKIGSGKIVVKAIAGYDEDGVVDGKTQIGGMEIVRTISVMSRGVVSDNGGWL